MVRIFLTTLAIGLGQCLSWADGVTNASTNSVVEKIGDYTYIRTNGHWIYANPAEFWNGVWKEGANGWRVQLRVYSETNWWFDAGRPGVPVSTNMMLRVEWGSPVKDSGRDFFMTPNGKFARFELLDANRKVIAPNPSAGTNLLERTLGAPESKIGRDGALIYRKSWLTYKPNLPAWASRENGSMQANFPEVISTNVYPFFSTSDLEGEILSFTNRPPPYIGILRLNEVYSVPKEGDYTLLVQPVLYKRNPTNRAVLNRVDLPSVATKVHLTPKVK